MYFRKRPLGMIIYSWLFTSRILKGIVTLFPHPSPLSPHPCHTAHSISVTSNLSSDITSSSPLPYCYRSVPHLTSPHLIVTSSSRRNPESSCGHHLTSPIVTTAPYHKLPKPHTTIHSGPHNATPKQTHHRNSLPHHTVASHHTASSHNNNIFLPHYRLQHHSICHHSTIPHSSHTTIEYHTITPPYHHNIPLHTTARKHTTIPSQSAQRSRGVALGWDKGDPEACLARLRSVRS